jgi:hypothetical protein
MTTQQPEQQPIQKNSLREQAAGWCGELLR